VLAVTKKQKTKQKQNKKERSGVVTSEVLAVAVVVAVIMVLDNPVGWNERPKMTITKKNNNNKNKTYLLAISRYIDFNNQRKKPINRLWLHLQIS
jgi:hypothetical protein